MHQAARNSNRPDGYPVAPFPDPCILAKLILQNNGAFILPANDKK